VITLDEAIRWHRQAKEAAETYGYLKAAEAQQLGIEALELIKHTRQNRQKPLLPRLPSEAKE
jgi:hypothetical protein